MRDELKNLFLAEGLDACAALAYGATRPGRRYLLDRIAGFVPRTVLLFLVPYYTRPGENISAYAVSRDYHGYMGELFTRLTPALAAAMPPYRFFGFADHAPIDERHAAATAGLGILGDNGLLIHPRYGSFVFIGEMFTDAPPDLCGACAPQDPARCPGCGACRRACPAGSGECLSAVTQKKGELTPAEEQMLLAYNTAWGCDICQNACPLNRACIENGGVITPLAWFHEARTPHLTYEQVARMPDGEFAARAYSFRGRQPLLRNLKLLEEEGPLHTAAAE